MSDSDDGLVVLDVASSDNVHIVSSVSRTPSTNTTNINNDPDDEDEDIIVTSVVTNPNNTHTPDPLADDDDDDVIVSGQQVRTSSPRSYLARIQAFNENADRYRRDNSMRIASRTRNLQAHRHLRSSESSSHSRRVVANGTGGDGAHRTVRILPRSHSNQLSEYDDQQLNQYQTLIFTSLSDFLSNRVPDQVLMQLAQYQSMDHQYNQQLNDTPSVADIKLVDIPEAIKSSQNTSFTSKVSSDTEYLCAMCGTELGVGFPTADEAEESGNSIKYRGINDTDRALSRRHYFAGCGHVYCGWCVSRYINRRTINQKNANNSKKRKGNTKASSRTTPKTNKNNIIAETSENGSKATIEDNFDRDEQSDDRLVNIHIPATCVAASCKRKLRPSAFKEFFL